MLVYNEEEKKKWDIIMASPTKRYYVQDPSTDKPPLEMDLPRELAKAMRGRLIVNLTRDRWNVGTGAP